MKKINLGLNFNEIIDRIEKEMSIQGLKPSQWAAKVGVKINLISNIHGKTRQIPSLEYIIAVARATKKPVEYYLYGENINNEKDGVIDAGPIGELISKTKAILESETDYAESLGTNIKTSYKALELEKRTSTLEDTCQQLAKKVNDLETASNKDSQ
jgi:hypothetical protein